ncbi:MAG: hypothetical protein GX751_06890 [Desulfuromonadaceae bacterium]|nr:hypothetical protein [Desulfuromonadaceae bacterium]
MTSQIPTRTRKRLEKNHALWMMGLVLFVSLASFFLGIMMGKRVAPVPAAGTVTETAPRIPVTVDKPAATVSPPQAPQAKEELESKLTFYETLPRSQGQPLGTGLNTPPVEPPKTVAKSVAASAPAPVSAPRVPASAAPVPSVSSPAPVSAPAPISVSAMTSPVPGKVAVQVGSFRKQQDAEALIQRLRKKGFPGVVVEVELPGKGVWFRAMVGPYEDRGAAAPVAQRLRKEEKMDVLIKQL